MDLLIFVEKKLAECEARGDTTKAAKLRELREILKELIEKESEEV